MITASEISAALDFPVRLLIENGIATIESLDATTVEPWHQAYVQQCWDAQAILPYDETKAEQLYEWQAADVPLSVSKPKFFVALYRSHQKTLSDIKTAIDNAITDADANYEAHVELDTCAEIQRDNPLVEAIGKNVWELTDTEINDVFKLAQSLTES